MQEANKCFDNKMVKNVHSRGLLIGRAGHSLAKQILTVNKSQ